MSSEKTSDSLSFLKFYWFPLSIMGLLIGMIIYGIISGWEITEPSEADKQEYRRREQIFSGYPK
jgi:hypothetical protein